MLTSKTSIPVWGLILFLGVAFALGGGAGWILFAPGKELTSVKSGELRFGAGTFTNPLLECEVAGEQSRTILKPFKAAVSKLLQGKVDSGILTEGSVYFRDLNNGMWFGINEDIGFRPASLLKVPIMLAYYKKAEKIPGTLQKKIRFREKSEIGRLQGIIPSQELVPGESYTVDDLIYRMISLSDNDAAQLLVENIDRQEINAVICDIDVNVDTCDQERLITTHAYSGFFRVLYNASYLTREYSEKALKLLSRSEFADGLRAGLPPGQLAATKFGEWGTGPDPNIVQLHEFGIVYHPRRPYLLGVMTRGRRGNDFAGVIREISQLVYASVDGQSGPDNLRIKTTPQLFQ